MRKSEYFSNFKLSVTTIIDAVEFIEFSEFMTFSEFIKTAWDLCIILSDKTSSSSYNKEVWIAVYNDVINQEFISFI